MKLSKILGNNNYLRLKNILDPQNNSVQPRHKTKQLCGMANS